MNTLAGRKWGSLTPEEQASLPEGTVLTVDEFRLESHGNGWWEGSGTTTTTTSARTGRSSR